MPSRNGTEEIEAGGSDREEDILDRVDGDLDLYREWGLIHKRERRRPDNPNRHVGRMLSQLLDSDGRVSRQRVRTFWGRNVFIGDQPHFGRLGGAALLSGARRGEAAILEEMFRILRRYECTDLLLKYPCPEAGRPLTYRRGRYRLTHRWARHIYHLKRMNQFLGPRLEPGFVTLDIGSGQGLFSSLVHQEYAGSHGVLVDLPEHLLVARYFLEMSFPRARIGGVNEFGKAGAITRETLAEFDFVLLPWQYFSRLEAGSVDLFTSFAALGEFRRPVFESYVNAPVFRAGRYLYTANPVRTLDMYAGSDVTVLDYPLEGGEGCFHFGISPVFVYQYGRPRTRWFFLDDRPRLPAFFEYIGGISGE